MRFVVMGAGGIGGVIGARLFEHGHEVVLIARRAHLDKIREDGLRLETPDSSVTLRIPAASDPAEIEFRGGDVVLLAVKSQDTVTAINALTAAAPVDIPIVCAQNGVDNERVALRVFPNIYGICVMLPATYLVPGVVQAHSTPTTGILDIGRYPSGADETAQAIAAALRDSTFSSEARPDIMRWKYAKLLANLGNAIEAIFGPAARQGSIAKRTREEGVACLRAAGIDFASEEEDSARRGDLMCMRPIGGQRREGGSSWQSLTRVAGSVETDYLNGEIVLLGRLFGVPTPLNAALQFHANRMARERQTPGSMSEEEFLRSLDAASLDG